MNTSFELHMTQKLKAIDAAYKNGYNKITVYINPLSILNNMLFLFSIPIAQLK
jgi:hypothetical protein